MEPGQLNDGLQDCGAFMIPSSSDVYEQTADVMPVHDTLEARNNFTELEPDEQEDVAVRCVRYMMCCDVKKKPVRKTDLSRYMFKEVKRLGRSPSHASLFKGGFEKAQQMLKDSFGWQIVELAKPVKAMSNNQRSDASRSVGSRSVGTVLNKGYILVSTLAPELRPEDPDTLPIIDFLTILVSIILLTPGCRIEEKALHSALKPLGIYVREKGGHKQINEGNVKEQLEKHFVEQWYIEREREEGKFSIR